MTKPAPSPSPFAFVRTFNPVFRRDRHDGWKPQKQVAFINALAESGCVTDACRRVGMSTESAYALRRRYDAIDFRLTWDSALDFAVKRLSDAALSRAIHGVPVPHYYKGEVVGEHRRFNETLTMFILRYRDPVTYAKSWDRRDIVKGHSEQEAEQLAVGIDSILSDGARRFCEANHAREQAEAYAADDLADLEARREAAYQAHIKAEDAAKAEAKRIADDEVAAARAREAEDFAAAAEREALNLTPAEQCARKAATTNGSPAATDDGNGAAATAVVRSAVLDLDNICRASAGKAAFRSDVASGSSTSADGDPATGADGAGHAGSAGGGGAAAGEDASHPDVASGSPVSGGSAAAADTSVVAAPPLRAPAIDVAAAAALGYRIVTAEPSPRRPPWQAPYWAERIA